MQCSLCQQPQKVILAGPPQPIGVFWQLVGPNGQPLKMGLFVCTECVAKMSAICRGTQLVQMPPNNSLPQPEPKETTEDTPPTLKITNPNPNPNPDTNSNSN